MVLCSRASSGILPSLGRSSESFPSLGNLPEPRSRGGARDRAGPEARVFAVLDAEASFGGAVTLLLVDPDELVHAPAGRQVIRSDGGPGLILGVVADLLVFGRDPNGSPRRQGLVKSHRIGVGARCVRAVGSKGMPRAGRPATAQRARSDLHFAVEGSKVASKAMLNSTARDPPLRRLPSPSGSSTESSQSVMGTQSPRPTALEADVTAASTTMLATAASIQAAMADLDALDSRRAATTREGTCR